MPEHSANKTTGKRMVLLVATLLLLPVLIASTLHLSGWRPAQTTNRGELLQPPRALPAEAFVDRQRKLLAASETRDKWIMLYVGTATCNEQCRDQIRLMRQVQVAQNKEMGRIRRAVLVPNTDALTAYLSDAGAEISTPDLLLLKPGPALATLLSDSIGRIVLIDPLGNVMMRYSATSDGKDMNKDMERLLKYSWAG